MQRRVSYRYLDTATWILLSLFEVLIVNIESRNDISVPANSYLRSKHLHNSCSHAQP